MTEQIFKRVLIVDDDDNILDSFEDLFEAHDWPDMVYDLCSDMPSAMKKIVAADSPYDLIVADLCMPGPDPKNYGYSGPYLIEAFLKRSRKDCIAVVISAQMDNWLIKNMGDQILMFSKPFKVPFLWAKSEDACKDIREGGSPKLTFFQTGAP